MRDKAIEVAEEQGWCTEGLNEVLEELGLDKLSRTWRRRVVLEFVYEWEGDENDDPGYMGVDGNGDDPVMITTLREDAPWRVDA